MDRVYSDEAYRLAQIAAIAASATPSDWDPTPKEAIDWVHELVIEAEESLNRERTVKR